MTQHVVYEVRLLPLVWEFFVASLFFMAVLYFYIRWRIAVQQVGRVCKDNADQHAEIVRLQRLYNKESRRATIFEIGLGRIEAVWRTSKLSYEDDANDMYSITQDTIRAELNDDEKFAERREAWADLLAENLKLEDRAAELAKERDMLYEALVRINNTHADDLDDIYKVAGNAIRDSNRGD